MKMIPTTLLRQGAMALVLCSMFFLTSCKQKAEETTATEEVATEAAAAPTDSTAAATGEDTSGGKGIVSVPDEKNK